jgi:hypothetical protein
MRVYISGKITGLPFQEVESKFYRAETYLVGLGYNVVNPVRNGLPQSASWEKHMLTDIDLLFDCDAIYLLRDWLDSKGAMIEKHIAEVTGKQMFYETKIEIEARKIEQETKIELALYRIKSAISEVAGCNFDDYTVRSKDQSGYFCRLIFVHQCMKAGIENQSLIAGWIHRDHSTVNRIKGKYLDEFKVNKHFRELAKQVDEKLSVNFVILP